MEREREREKKVKRKTESAAIKSAHSSRAAHLFDVIIWEPKPFVCLLAHDLMFGLVSLVIRLVALPHSGQLYQRQTSKRTNEKKKQILHAFDDKATQKCSNTNQIAW